MILSVLCVAAAATFASASTTTPASYESPSPFSSTDPLCQLTDSPDVCQMKRINCGFITKALSPPGGYIKTFINCAKDAGIPLSPVFFMSIGEAYKNGVPESLGEMTSPDPSVVVGIRRCAMNATGLVLPDLSLDKKSVASALTVASGGSPYGDVVAAAVTSCPKPRLYKMADYMSCLKKRCADSLVLPVTSSPGIL